MVGLKINFNESEVWWIMMETIGQVYADLFKCLIGLFSIKYLEVHSSPSRLHVRLVASSGYKKQKNGCAERRKYAHSRESNLNWC